MDAAQSLKQIAFLLERSLAPTYKVQAFRKAAAVLDELPADDFDRLRKQNKLQTLAGIGATSEKAILEASAGETPEYLRSLQAEPWPPIEIPAAAWELRRALKGDCHTHSLWSDGGSSIEEMGRTARELGHEYMVLTDHSPRLTVANGLSPERLRAQFEELDEVNRRFSAETDDGAPPFRIRRGIEVDINEDGTLDQLDELLDELDVVVASVHSKLRAESEVMTPRMLAAIENPRSVILGHCTGRKLVGRGRPPSSFDAKAVFEACVATGTAVEINCRPERMDPPDDLLEMAVEMGCTFAMDTDAHAPGQLDFQILGCARAVAYGITTDRIVNTKTPPFTA